MGCDQGCDSEISSMVTEAHRKSGQCLDTALLVISHLAALTATQLHLTELGSEATGKVNVTTLTVFLLLTLSPYTAFHID